MIALPDNINELVNIVLEENLECPFSLPQENPMFLMTNTPEAHLMQKYYKETKIFPKLLVTHNNASMQRAYLSVSQDIWIERVLDLQMALQSTLNSEKARRDMVTRSPALHMLPEVTELLDRAFLSKYDELMLRVRNDFYNFFPYKIGQMSPQLMIFEKMDQVELISYVMKRF